MLPNLKLSYYNHFVPIENRQVFVIYNTFSGSMLELEWDLGTRISKMNSMEIHFLEDEIIDRLLQHGMIVDNAFNEFNAIFNSAERNRADIQDSEILFMVISPTNSCNMSCPYCFQGDKSIKAGDTKYLSEENIEHLKAYVNTTIATTKIKKIAIEWFGGEPLIKSNIIEEFSEYVINLANKNSILYEASIITNGVLLNEKNYDILEKSKVRKIQITIDGNKEMHDSVRYLNNGKGTYQKILDNLKNIPKHKFYFILRINGDKRVFDKLEGLFEDLEAMEIWPQRNDEIQFDWSPKFFNVTGFNEEKAFYYTSYEYQKSREDFAKLKISRYNKWASNNARNSKTLTYALPEPAKFYCATVESPYSISLDDGGFIHKCYNTVNDKSKRIQHISDFDPYGAGTDYYMNFDKTKVADCSTCKVLPICEENCNMRFVTNAESKICSSWKYFMNERISAIYEKNFAD
ncbi:radical SAM protein [Pedobacter sp. MR2016-19]|uniref:radical SAM protein n=1 Tax=Pedobacter sp. MR2016-19 TaxID=2780089 RepID=UPI0018765E3A|nr:radical SAM protein [Pedobacter sp. MR2016-19]MBE5317737.1 radical SAM protein [Pedobacter sp. MR2016-19]